MLTCVTVSTTCGKISLWTVYNNEGLPCRRGDVLAVYSRHAAGRSQINELLEQLQVDQQTCRCCNRFNGHVRRIQQQRTGFFQRTRHALDNIRSSGRATVRCMYRIIECRAWSWWSREAIRKKAIFITKTKWKPQHEPSIQDSVQMIQLSRHIGLHYVILQKFIQIAPGASLPQSKVKIVGHRREFSLILLNVLCCCIGPMNITSFQLCCDEFIE